jgi:hypothetical protein
MSGESFVELAIDALHSVVSLGFTAQLRAVETAQSLTPNSLPDPVAYVPARVEWDNRVPIIGVYDDGFSMIHQRESYVSVDATIAIAVNSPTDIISGAVTLRRYVTALIRLIESNKTLANRVSACLIGKGATTGVIGDAAACRLIYLIPVEIRTHSP